MCPVVLGHIGIDAAGDIEINRPQRLHRDTVFLHNKAGHRHQPLGVRQLRRLFQSAVDEDGFEVGEIPFTGVNHSLLFFA